MEKSHLENLPLEILLQIVECLHATDRQALLWLGLTKKSMLETTLPLAFSDIRLVLSNPAQFKADVNQLTRVLRHANAMKCVRHINIASVNTERWQPGTRLHYHAPWLAFSGLSQMHEEFLDMVEEGIEDYDDGYYNFPSHARDAELTRENGWEPLVTLIAHRELALHTLTFDYRGEFPPNLINALHEYQPRCRLVVRGLELRRAGDQWKAMFDPSLLLSPLLDGLEIRVYSTTPWHEDLTTSLLLGALVRLTPNLARLELSSSDWNPPDLESFPSHDVSKVFNRQHKDHSHNAPFPSGNPADLANSATSKALVEFAHLEYLKLGHQNPRAWEWIENHVSFPKLKSLVARFGTTPVKFLNKLPPLQEVGIAGDVDLDAIDCLYNSSLRTLVLGPFSHQNFAQGVMDEARMRKLVRACPSLEVLEVSTKRSKGSVEETRIYKALADLKHLRVLRLILTCCCEDSNLARGTSMEKAVAAETYRTSLINLAMDEKLALSIRRMVLGSRPPQALELLLLAAEDAHWRGEWFPVMGELEHDFTADRELAVRPRVSNDEVTLTIVENEDVYNAFRLARDPELAQQQREVSDSSLTDYRDCIAGLRQVWPGDWKDSEWRTCWESFDLQEE